MVRPTSDVCDTIEWMVMSSGTPVGGVVASGADGRTLGIGLGDGLGGVTRGKADNGRIPLGYKPGVVGRGMLRCDIVGMRVCGVNKVIGFSDFLT